jgi:ribosomal protein S18 acetylase RimI-like enzyme
MTHTVRSLIDTPFSIVHETMREAFADYPTSTRAIPKSVLYNRALKNGLDLDLSAGVFAADTLVGITLIGVDQFAGHSSAYDIATGVVPSHRGQGLVGAMLAFIEPRLQARAVDRFVLEVLRQNDSAIRAYSKAGFSVVRRFECYELVRERLVDSSRTEEIQVEVLDIRSLDEAEGWIDWQPSWENSFNSIRRIPDPMLILGARHGSRTVGVLAYYPALGWIHTIAIDPQFRRRAVGSRLIESLTQKTADQERWKLNNVLNTDSATQAFLFDRGFSFTIGQFEMAKRLT